MRSISFQEVLDGRPYYRRCRHGALDDVNCNWFGFGSSREIFPGESCKIWVTVENARGPTFLRTSFFTSLYQLKFIYLALVAFISHKPMLPTR